MFDLITGLIGLFVARVLVRRLSVHLHELGLELDDPLLESRLFFLRGAQLMAEDIGLGLFDLLLESLLLCPEVGIQLLTLVLELLVDLFLFLPEGALRLLGLLLELLLR